MKPESWGGFKKDLTGHLDIHLEGHYRNFIRSTEKSTKDVDFKEFQRLLNLKSRNYVNSFFNGSNGSGMIQIQINGSHFKILDSPVGLVKIKKRMNQLWLNKPITKKRKGPKMKKADLKGTEKTDIDKKTDQDPVKDKKPDPKNPKDPKKSTKPAPKPPPAKDQKPDPKKSAKTGDKTDKPAGKGSSKKDDKPKKITAVNVAEMVNKAPSKMSLKKVKGFIPDYKFHLHKNQWVATFFRHVEPKHHEKYKSLKPAPKKTKGKEGADNGKAESEPNNNDTGGQDPKTKPPTDS